MSGLPVLVLPELEQRDGVAGARAKVTEGAGSAADTATIRVSVMKPGLLTPTAYDPYGRSPIENGVAPRLTPLIVTLAPAGVERMSSRPADAVRRAAAAASGVLAVARAGAAGVIDALVPISAPGPRRAGAVGADDPALV